MTIYKGKAVSASYHYKESKRAGGPILTVLIDVPTEDGGWARLSKMVRAQDVEYEDELIVSAIIVQRVIIEGKEEVVEQRIMFGIPYTVVGIEWDIPEDLEVMEMEGKPPVYIANEAYIDCLYEEMPVLVREDELIAA